MIRPLLITVSLLCANALAQEITRGADWDIPRTEYGHADLQGVWSFGSQTPFQRPQHLSDKAYYTPAEAAKIEDEFRSDIADDATHIDPDRAAPPAGVAIGQEADAGFLNHTFTPKLLEIRGKYPTSIITQPENGRLPYRDSFKDFHEKRAEIGLIETEAFGPEVLRLSTRCLVWGAAVPNLVPIRINPILQIIQSKNHVVIQTELINDARIIKLSSKKRESGVRKWFGNSYGYWDGDTLVVETKNFRPEQSHFRLLRMSSEFELTERFSIIDDDQIFYQFIITDDLALSEEVAGETIFKRNSDSDRIYEFGCHEGNYSMAGILAGARRAQLNN